MLKGHEMETLMKVLPHHMRPYLFNYVFVRTFLSYVC